MTVTDTAQLWLTRVALDVSNRDVVRDIADVQAMHRSVMHLFPHVQTDRARADAHVLWQLDQRHTPVLLVQATTRPDESAIPDRWALEVASTNLFPVVERLADAASVRFECTVNTAKRVARGDGEKAGKVVAVPPSEIPQWWCALAARNGLVVDPGLLAVTDVRTLLGTKVTASGAKTRVRHAVATVRGVATVSDASLAERALVGGVGRGRSHGCGLLKLLPVG